MKYARGHSTHENSAPCLEPYGTSKISPSPPPSVSLGVTLPKCPTFTSLGRKGKLTPKRLMHTRGRVCPFLDSTKEPFEIAGVFGLGDVQVCESLSLSLSGSFGQEHCAFLFFSRSFVGFALRSFTFVSS